MFVRFDDTSLITNRLVFGNTGHGVIAQDVPSTGDNGGSFLYNDLNLPADNNKSIRGEVTNRPIVGELFIYEDGSFSAIAFPDGIHTFNYQLYVDGVPTGSPATVTLVVGETTSPFNGNIGKLNYTSSTKQLGITTGTNIPLLTSLDKSNLTLSGKPMGVSVGTVIPFEGLLNKTSLSLSGEVLDVVVGTVIPHSSSLNKSTLLYTPKQLGFYTVVNTPVIVDINKSSIGLTGRSFTIGEITYPIIEIARIFFIKRRR